jgi:hypothetical protein
MNDGTICAALQGTGMPVAYDHFAEGEAPEPPYVVYRNPGSDNFKADGRVYHKVDELDVELYTDRKDVGAEAKVEAVLDGMELFYDKAETFISSEKLYMVRYETEV